ASMHRTPGRHQRRKGFPEKETTNNQMRALDVRDTIAHVDEFCLEENGTAGDAHCAVCPSGYQKPQPLESTILGGHLLAYVQAANPQEQIELEGIKDTLEASTWFAASNGKYDSKNSFQRTTEWDSTERSLSFKLLLGNGPVMKRHVAWYPLVYPETEIMR
ncbi:hypothetical protein LPJ81_006941, partial [Coemansia sp. IMI 209127]